MLISDAVATVVAAFIAAMASVGAAILSRKSANESAAVNHAMRIRQARLDERDFIGLAGGSLIPAENDAMWHEYFEQARSLVNSGKSAADARREASAKVLSKAPDLPSVTVRDPIRP